MDLILAMDIIIIMGMVMVMDIGVGIMDTVMLMPIATTLFMVIFMVNSN